MVLSLSRLSTLRLNSKVFRYSLNTLSTSVEYVQGQSPGKNLREYFYYIDHQGMLFLDDARMKNFTSCFKECSITWKGWVIEISSYEAVLKPRTVTPPDVSSTVESPSFSSCFLYLNFGDNFRRINIVQLVYTYKEFLVFFFKRIRPNTTSRYEDSFPFVSLCGRERNFIRCDDVPIVYTHVIEKDGKNYFCYGNAGDLMYNEFNPEKVYMAPDTGRVYHPCHETAGSVGLVASKLAIEFSKYFLFDNGEGKPPTHFKWKNNLFTLDTDWFFKYYESLKKCQLSNKI